MNATHTEVYTGIELCDKCHVRATTIVNKQQFVLCFCNHHKDKYEASLIGQGWLISPLGE